MTKKIASVLLAVLMLAATLSAAGCSAKDDDAVPATGEVINVYNWGEYISDGEDGSIDVLEEFTRQTGIEVNYTTFASNEEMYAKISSGAADYDVIIPSDYMIEKMIEEDMLEKLNFDNIPNFKYIDKKYIGLGYDPKSEYSVPYTWGTVGVFYNKTMVDEADIEWQSWDLLWNEKYAGNILMFDNQRDGTPDTHEQAIQAIKEAECFICTDLNAPTRMGDMHKDVMKNPAPKILIDHHLEPEADSFDVVISHPEASAASELIYTFMLQMGDDSLLDRQIATQIYCGMMTDTGQFIFGSSRPQVYLIVARLLQEGFEKEKLHRDLVLEPERRTRLKGYVLQQKLQIVPDSKAAYFSLNKAELKRFNHQKGDSEGFVNMPLDIIGIQVSAFFREEKNFVKVSLRSKGDFPVNLLAQKFYNGGGHKNAAGGEFLGNLQQAEQLFVKALPLFANYLEK